MKYESQKSLQNPPRFQLIRKEAYLTLRLGLPIIAAQLLHMSMSFVDTVMSGNYGTLDLAAVALGSSLFYPIYALNGGILMAMSPIISHLYGARKFALIGKNVRQGLWLALILSIPAILALRNLDFILILMGIPTDTQAITSGYVNAIAWGLPGAFGFMALRYFNESLGNSRPIMYVALIGLAFNIAGNNALIYGRFGFPELGAVGTGWASAIVLWAMFISLLIYTWSKKNYKRFNLFQNLRWPEKQYLGEILRLGIPIGISSTMEVTMFALTALLMGSLGTLAVAGHQVAINIAALTFMIPFGLSSAITVRVGHALGRGSLTNARFAGFVGITLSVMIMTCTAILMFTFPGHITSIYTNDPDVQSIAIGLIYMAAIFQISDGLQVSGYGALRGLKDTKIPMYVNLLAYWIIGLPLGYILGIYLKFGPQGLWIGLISGLSVAALLHNIRFNVLTK
ncbi:MAG: MATE family efflux transporter [Balneolales bacterium]